MRVSLVQLGHILHVSIAVVFLAGFSLILATSIFIDRSFLLNNVHVLVGLLVLDAFCLVFFSLVARRLIRELSFLSSPVVYYLDELKPKVIAGECKDKALSLSEKVGIEPPLVVEVSGSPNVYSFGSGSDNSVLVFRGELHKHLDGDELESVLLHEMFHIKTDVEIQSFIMEADRIANLRSLNLTNLYIGTIVMVVIAMVFSVIAKFSGGIAVPMEIYKGLNVFFLGFIVASISIATGYALIIWKTVPKMSGKYAYVRELLADAYAVLMNCKPTKLYSALIRVNTLQRKYDVQKPTMIDKMCFVSPEGESYPFLKKNLTIKDIFETKLWSIKAILPQKMEVACPMELRLSHIKTIQTLLQKTVTLSVKNNKTYLSKLEIARLPPPVHQLLIARPSKYMEFQDYASKHASNFNLVSCSGHLQSSLFDTYLMFFAAVNLGVADMVTTDFGGKSFHEE